MSQSAQFPLYPGSQDQPQPQPHADVAPPALIEQSSLTDAVDAMNTSFAEWQDSLDIAKQDAGVAGVDRKTAEAALQTERSTGGRLIAPGLLIAFGVVFQVPVFSAATTTGSYALAITGVVSGLVAGVGGITIATSEIRRHRSQIKKSQRQLKALDQAENARAVVQARDDFTHAMGRVSEITGIKPQLAEGTSQPTMEQAATAVQKANSLANRRTQNILHETIQTRALGMGVSQSPAAARLEASHSDSQLEATPAPVEQSAQTQPPALEARGIDPIGR